MENKPIRIHFAGGGTAGHLYPALAIAKEFSNRFPNCEIAFWGTKKGIEFRLKDQLEYRLNFIRIRGLKRNLTLSNLLIPLEFIASVINLLLQFLWKRPDLIVGSGGYVSLPVVSSAATLRIPTAIHEQNSFPGASTRLLGKLAKRIYLTYESSEKYFKNKEKIRVFGNPVRQIDSLIDPSVAIQEFELDPNLKTLFVFGGSQGALKINEFMIEIAPQLIQECGIQIIWATGSIHYEKISKKMAVHSGLKLFPFIHRIYSAYTGCNLCICRAGATTIAELTYLEVPAILIPFPYATAGHQEYNARDLESKGAAICLLEDDLNADKLFKVIKETINDDVKLSKMKMNMKSLARPNAAHDIVSDLCDTLLSN